MHTYFTSSTTHDLHSAVTVDSCLCVVSFSISFQSTMDAYIHTSQALPRTTFTLLSQLTLVFVLFPSQYLAKALCMHTYFTSSTTHDLHSAVTVDSCLCVVSFSISFQSTMDAYIHTSQALPRTTFTLLSQLTLVFVLFPSQYLAKALCMHTYFTSSNTHNLHSAVTVDSRFLFYLFFVLYCLVLFCLIWFCLVVVLCSLAK